MEADALDVFGLEFLLGAVEEDAEIFAVHIKFLTDFVAVALVEKDGFEEGAVAERQAEKNFADFLFDLAGRDDVEGVSAGGGQLRPAFYVQRLVVGAGGAVVLGENVIAYRIDESSEAFRLAEAAVFAKDGENAGKGLLADVFNGLRGLEAGAELELEKLSEIGDKVLLGLTVARTETLDISSIERLEFQIQLRRPARPRV